jgi:hypothetical protein
VTERFDANMSEYFGAELGAYSVVTNDEHNKSQITFVGPEKEIALAYFGDRLNNNHGSRDDIERAGGNPDLEFRVFPSGDRIKLTVSFKKGRPNELRYYLKLGDFKPKAGDYWGLFIRQHEIWMCQFSEWMLLQIKAGLLGSKNSFNFLEPDDDGFQELINSAPPSQVMAQATKWKRDPSLASKALQANGYICELYPKLRTFVSKSSGNTYQEAHHLVPMSQQANITENLDSLDNICVLGPFAHRKIHHAKFDFILPDLRILIRKRPSLLERLNILEDDVLGFYNR